MRQAGLLAAAGLYAFNHNIDRLAEDHRRASQLGTALEALPWVATVAPVDTNIVVFTLVASLNASRVLDHLKAQGLMISSMGSGVLRLVTHLDVSQEAVNQACQALARFDPAAGS